MVRLALLLLFAFKIIFAQSVGQFYVFDSPRLARSLALGNSYAGVAEGIETIHYNAAGLATLNEISFYYSNGEGWPIAQNLNPHNFGILIPLFGTKGSIAFSANTLGLDNPKFQYSMYQFHVGRSLNQNLALGSSFNIYRISMLDLHTGYAYDISISALYSLNSLISLNVVDDSKIGAQFQNVLGSEVKYSELNSEPIFQTIRGGLSFKVLPFGATSFGRYVNSILVASDIILEGARYNFEYWQINFGFELELLRHLYLRYGRESKYSSNSDYHTSLFPINRFGFGLVIPVNNLLGTQHNVNMKFDFGRSDWNINESEYVEILSQHNGIARNIYSFQIEYHK